MVVRILESPVSAPEKKSLKDIRKERLKALKDLKNKIPRLPGVNCELKDYGDLERLSIWYQKTVHKDKGRELVLVSRLDVYYDVRKETYYHFGSEATTVNASGWVSHNKKVHSLRQSSGMSLSSVIHEIKTYFKEVDQKSKSLKLK